ncbi:ABC transporter ATP-binding protein [Enterococcus ureasiticus]|uniref:ABC transporter n=1 Tax=Enterococcus ureasiticus TaxID=903984 RepID=A0A1E5G8L5_9ENTE|nr:ABC transporter ATP-binding protein [Enterococcus ureasiticus]OEG09019.1 ABC transporter [Enterococcus ureasiticus]
MNITANQITKKYGETTALQSVSFDFPKNSIVGVVGHNGSGKTTLLEILCGLRKEDGGKMNVKIDKKYKSKLGVVLQNNAFYDDAKVIELLKLFSSFYKESVDIDELMDITQIKEYSHKFYKDLSGGMKQKVNIALALLNNPEIMILDEPTTGLDPIARKELWDIVHRFAKENIVFLSSHYMDEVESNCTHILFLKKGRVVECGKISDILNKHDTNMNDLYLEKNKGA